jgi:hypothetical protein
MDGRARVAVRGDGFVTPDLHKASKELFEQALELPSGRWADWLQEQNASETIKAEVSRLLALHARAGNSFLDSEMLEIGVALNSPATAPLLAGVLLAERYRLRGQLGEGGMGEVYEAWDETLRQPVAIKFLKEGFLPDAAGIERFRREALLTRQISHRNVCRIHEFGQTLSGFETRHYFTMELLAGETLKQRLARPDPISPDDAEVILLEILAGLEAVHSLGITHRDLKPANIMLVPEPGGRRVVLMDFGLALSVDQSSLTETGKTLGTLDYMAPEQLQGKETGPWTDIYALGLILYELVTGEKPFIADSPVASALKRLKVHPPRPVGKSFELESRWVNTIMSCLERDPSRRPASSRQVVALIGGRSTRRQIQTRRRWIAGTIVVPVAAFAGYRWWPRARTWDPGAIHANRLGEEFAKRRTPGDLRNAIAEFETALRKEPEYGPAWTGLADAWSALANFGFDPRSATSRCPPAVLRESDCSLGVCLFDRHSALASSGALLPQGRVYRSQGSKRPAVVRRAPRACRQIRRSTPTPPSRAGERAHEFRAEPAGRPDVPVSA